MTTKAPLISNYIKFTQAHTELYNLENAFRTHRSTETAQNSTKLMMDSLDLADRLESIRDQWVSLHEKMANDKAVLGNPHNRYWLNLKDDFDPLFERIDTIFYHSLESHPDGEIYLQSHFDGQGNRDYPLREVITKVRQLSKEKFLCLMIGRTIDQDLTGVGKGYWISADHFGSWEKKPFSSYKDRIHLIFDADNPLSSILFRHLFNAVCVDFSTYTFFSIRKDVPLPFQHPVDRLNFLLKPKNPSELILEMDTSIRTWSYEEKKAIPGELEKTTPDRLKLRFQNVETMRHPPLLPPKRRTHVTGSYPQKAFTYYHASGPKKPLCEESSIGA